jgi:hypothetical protein
MTDFRALCAELLSEIDAGRAAVLNRVTVKLRAALDEPEGEGASVEQVAQIVYENAMLATAPYHAKPHWPSWADLPNSDARIHALNTAGIILARWGRSAASAVKPIPLSERLPEDADCLVSKYGSRYCWLGVEVMHGGRARLTWNWKLFPLTIEQRDYLLYYWLPASTRFLPTTVDPGQPL